MSSCPSLSVTVPLQLPPRYTRAHTVKASPATTSTRAPPKRSGPGGSSGRDSQCPRCGCGQAISTAPAASGTTCESLEPSDSPPPRPLRAVRRDDPVKRPREPQPVEELPVAEH